MRFRTIFLAAALSAGFAPHKGAEPPTVASGRAPRMHRDVSWVGHAGGPAGWRAIVDRDTGVPVRMWGPSLAAPGATRDAAIAGFDRYLTAYPSGPQAASARWFRGWCSWREGRRDEAVLTWRALPYGSPLAVAARYWTARAAGKPATFAICCLIILGWAVTGPIFHYSDTWQLIINTGTTIITFLMVFLIQNTQNRDGAALQAKLDELIRATRDARNQCMHIEKLSEEELDEMREDCEREAAR